MNKGALTVCLLLLAAAARPDERALDATLSASVRELAQQGVSAPPGAARVEVEVGRLDPRLRLAPCERIEPHLPPGTRLWGASRIGLRCAAGPSRWNVFLPVTVRVFGRSLVARTSLPVGATLTAADLAEAEVDLAADRGTAIADVSRLVGRTLARDIAPGTALRDVHLKARAWFAAGESVRIVAVGAGWQIAGEGVALAPGFEGQSVRVRTESGRILSGRATGLRKIEVGL